MQSRFGVKLAPKREWDKQLDEMMCVASVYHVIYTFTVYRRRRKQMSVSSLAIYSVICK